MANWSELPCDILGHIMLNLDAIEDCVYCSAVCHSWNNAYSIAKETMNQRNGLKLMPLLLLAEDNELDPNKDRYMLSISSNRRFRLKLPEISGRRCWGSSCGWLVTFGLDLKIQLFNPLTKAMLDLPPCSTLPFFPPFQHPEVFNTHRLFRCLVSKAFVLQFHGYEEVFVFVAYMEYSRLAFARPGDNTWTHIDTPSRLKVLDVCCWNDKVFAIFEDGSIRFCDIANNSTHMCEFMPKKFDKLFWHKFYMVNILGDLFIVLRQREYPEDSVMRGVNVVEDVADVRAINEGEDVAADEGEDVAADEGEDVGADEGQDDVVDKGEDDAGDGNGDNATDEGEDDASDEGVYDGPCYMTRVLKLFKLDLHSKEWREIDDAGQVSLFVGDNTSMVIPIRKTDVSKHNCVYMNDDDQENWAVPKRFGGHDMGVCNWKDGEFVSFYEGDDIHSDFCTPFFFIPRI